MAMKIITNAAINHINIILNLSRSSDFLLAKADPIVIKITAVIIIRIWISPKNNRSNDALASLKFFQKYCTMGLLI